ncbi:hypothetical protein [Bacillus phage Tavor_SA]|uniref:Uncharacterized protein n=1 Tax=Bacillus phage Tavor_SA TaxID=1983581 RepID=A0A288WFR0_9CAUD|nr:hypothetical protein P9C75_gp47 [Bacillus phage Tavor_SA]ARW58426.1 hypothetical protein [Bacillus phage Tavor_SA]
MDLKCIQCSQCGKCGNHNGICKECFEKILVRNGEMESQFENTISITEKGGLGMENQKELDWLQIEKIKRERLLSKYNNEHIMARKHAAIDLLEKELIIIDSIYKKLK